MCKQLLLSGCLALFVVFNTGAQANTTSAKVNVSVTDMKNKPRKGDLVIFRGKKLKKIFSGITDVQGKFSIQLPSDDKYQVNVKNLGDTTHYGELNIPALQPNQFYTEPFVIDIKYEPARTFQLNNVQFDFGKATLRPGSYPQLQELLDYMQAKEDTRIEIAGHTDNIGKEADNLKLSQERANTIQEYLLKKGIDPGRITARGYGATQPIADNSTEAGRQINRRTEVRIL